ncbi:uncharacterized protein LOC119289667 [Triticum dicoccoides]|uniref:uncharacterized protein LOC119289667 n=1 Tax=Triticum dicoccoides TaxID=85692 RepID=UPI00188F9207|nr:uncharacterized protein LOC119289667 [Triticum dicoccoides]
MEAPTPRHPPCFLLVASPPGSKRGRVGRRQGSSDERLRSADTLDLCALAKLVEPETDWKTFSDILELAVEGRGSRDKNDRWAWKIHQKQKKIFSKLRKRAIEAGDQL